MGLVGAGGRGKGGMSGTAPGGCTPSVGGPGGTALYATMGPIGIGGRGR